MATINNLPDEILLRLLYYVPIEERIFYTSLVCKRWRRLVPFNDFREFRLEKFHRENCSAGSECNLKAAGRDKQLIKLWMKGYLNKLLPSYGYYLTAIDLRFVNSYHRLLVDGDIMQMIYENCPRVIALNLHNCELSREALLWLTKFDRLTNLAVVDDWKFELVDLHNHLPNLTHFDSRMSRPFGHVTKPENLLSIRTDIGSNFFLNLNMFCSRYANVQELYIKNCRWVSPENFSLIGRLGQLKILHLDMQDDLLSSQEIEDICAGCPTLEDVSISYTSENGGNNLNFAPFKRLGRLKNLRFNVECIYGVQLAVLADLHTLKYLDLCCTEFRNVDEFFVKVLSEDTKWPNLERFCAFCKTDINLCNKVQNSFIKYSNSLSVLGVSAFSPDSNVQVDVLSDYLNTSKLELLSEIRLRCNNSDELSRFFENSTLTRLEFMQIQGNAEIDHDLIKFVHRCCPNLAELHLSNDIQIAEEVCSTLLETFQNLKKLKISSAIALQLPTERLMRILGEHRRLRNFEFLKLLPAYHIRHFKAIVDGRRRLNEEGLLTNPLYIETTGTFYLPICILNDLKALNICFTNACLIRAKFQNEHIV